MGVKKGGKAKSRNIKTKKAVKSAQKKAKTLHEKRALKKAAVQKYANTELTKDVPVEYSFWLCDGREVRNTAQLAKFAHTMSDETYDYHANMQKNDFADWIRDIVKNEELAYNVRKSKNRKEMSAVINKFLGKKPEEEKITEIKPKNAEIIPVIKPKADKIQLEEKSPIEKIIEEKKNIQTEKLPALKKKEVKHETPKIIHDELSILKKREEELTKEEAKLSEEEQKLNALRIELTKKRYELLKKRGALEKEMFEHFLSKRPAMPEIPKPAATTFERNSPILELGREKVESLISEVRQKLANGEIQEATKKYIEAEESLNRSPIRPDEKRSLRFQIMELEADIKLAGIKH